MHALDDVPTIIEDATDVLRIDCTSEVWVTVMSAASACAYSLQKKKKQI